MAIPAALVEAVIAVFAVVAVCLSFQAKRVPPAWWILLGLSGVFGGTAGFWIALNFSYEPSPGFVVYSFPVPGGFLVLETYDDRTQQWVDFITPLPFLVAMANASLLLSIPVGFVWLAHCLVSRDPERNKPATPTE